MQRIKIWESTIKNTNFYFYPYGDQSVTDWAVSVLRDNGCIVSSDLVGDKETFYMTQKGQPRAIATLIAFSEDEYKSIFKKVVYNAERQADRTADAAPEE